MTPATILVVDDDLTSLRVMAATLAREGYLVRPADSGALALASAQASHPDLILLDLYMPELDGFAVLDALRAEPSTADIPVLFLSATTEASERIRAFKKGALDFVTKPFEQGELLARVQTHLELSRLRRQLEARARELQSENERLLRDELEARQRSEALALAGEQLVRSVIEVLPIGVCIIDSTGSVTSANQAARRVWGVLGPASEALFKDYGSWKVLADGRRVTHAWAGRRALERGELTLDEELEIEAFDKVHKTVLHSAVPLRRRSDTLDGAIIVLQDITERRAAERAIEALAFFDPLTKLANRRLLFERIALATSSGHDGGPHYALAFIDLDHFKRLNDTLGHSTGDLVLQQVADRLRGSTRASDTVARFGGDEFVVLLSGLSRDSAEAGEQARAAAASILGAFKAPFSVPSGQQPMTASVGVALFRGPETSSDAVMRLADEALYAAKAAGRNAVHFALVQPPPRAVGDGAGI